MRTRSTRTCIALSSSLVLSVAPIVTDAQTTPPEPVTLGALQADAVRRDPRGLAIELLARQSELRLQNIDAERLPALAINGQAQYQSTVASIPIMLPGVDIPVPPHDTYDANLSARQNLFDPAIASRRSVERAQLAESQARIRSTLFTLRQAVSDAYFMALELQLQAREIEVGIADLEAQLRVASDRVKEGAALPSEQRIIEAELLRRRQSVAALTANRDASLAVLSDLTGRQLGATADLGIPDLSSAVSDARAAIDRTRARPEFEQFLLTREVLARQRSLASARELPRISAFGRAGYGRPGLNPLASQFDTYWLTGVQLEWSPWTWGAPARERQVLSLQQQIVEREESSFAESIRRATIRDVATIDRLTAATSEDDAIAALREQVLNEARLRYAEGVITSADYVDRQTDVIAARVTRDAHRVELARARARLLTTLGLEVR